MMRRLVEFGKSGSGVPGWLRARVRDGWDLYHRSTASLRVLPQYQIIGAQKCGTSSLLAYLCAHPCVGRPSTKEVHYFDLNYDKTVKWYRSHFSYRWRKVISGEASPYYIHHPLVSQRMWDLTPKAKLIVLLRNPVDRAYSHYEHSVRTGFETLSFEDALNEEDERIAGEFEKMLENPLYVSFRHRELSYRTKGIYAEQLKPWLNKFPREQFLFVRSEDLFDDPAVTYRSVLDFLGLPPFDGVNFVAKNQHAYRSVFDEGTRKYLEVFYESWNRRLYEMIERDMEW